MRNRYKILPLDSPFKYNKRYWDNCVEEKNRIEPIFNRNGWFLDRLTKRTWLEINGEAWLYSTPDYFKYELKTSTGNNRIHPESFNAIEILIRNHLASKKLKEVYYTERDIRMLREVYVTSSKSALGMRKRFKDFKEKRGL